MSNLTVNPHRSYNAFQASSKSSPLIQNDRIKSNYTLVEGEVSRNINDEQTPAAENYDIVVIPNSAKSGYRRNIDETFSNFVIDNTLISESMGIEKANRFAIQNARGIVESLAEVGVDTLRIVNNVDGGVTLVYKVSDSIFCYVEIYNDGDAGYIVEDTLNNKTLKNKEVVVEKLEQNILSLLREYNCPS